MDEREAIEAIELLFSDSTGENYPYSEKFGEAMDMAISALEKQTAVPRIIIEGKYFCPVCKNLMPYPGYCGCGQKVY